MRRVLRWGMGWLTGLMLCQAQAADQTWRQAHSLRPDELVIGATAPLGPYYSPASVAPFQLTVLPCDPPSCADQGGEVWKVSGVMLSLADVRRQWEAAATHSRPRKLLLDSEGGAAAGAQFLARQVLTQHLEVEVPDDATCVSSCVYVLTAGRIRTVGHWALVGVHQQNGTRGWVATLEGVPFTQLDPHALDTSPHVFNLAAVVKRVDDANVETQANDGQWAFLMAQSNVSPLLLYLASLATQTYHSKASMAVLTHTCAVLLNLDNTTPSARPVSADEVLRGCVGQGKEGSP